MSARLAAPAETRLRFTASHINASWHSRLSSAAKDQIADANASDTGTPLTIMTSLPPQSPNVNKTRTLSRERWKAYFFKLLFNQIDINP
jgi:hypothetical protein